MEVIEILIAVLITAIAVECLFRMIVFAKTGKGKPKYNDPAFGYIKEIIKGE